MAASSPEKLQNKKSFTDLIHLREELTKEAQNKERLTQFQKTIDTALEEGKKKGIIEFTETEWRTLISNENLPPVEEVQALLQEKIDSAKEVTAETKEKTGGLIGELQKKAEGLTGEAQKKIEELQKKAEDLKKYSKPGLWLLGIGLSLKLWGYKIANWFSGLFGKKGEYDEKIKLAEMEKEFLENPEAAMKKYGADALEKMEGGKVEQKEGGALEKVGPLAALGLVGTGILTLIKWNLPEEMQKGLSWLDQKSLLGKLARNRALRLFGVGGVALFGIGKLYEYIEKNGTSLGEMPTDAEGKKSWWKNALEKAGIGAKEGAEEIWAILNGSKLEEHFEKDTPRDGYVFLQDHKTIQGAKKEVLAFEKRCERIYSEHQDAFNTAAAFWMILKPGMFVGATLKWTAMMLSLLKFASPGLIVPAGLIVALTSNSIEGIQHMQVPEDMGPEDLRDMLNIPDISNFLKSHMGELPNDINFDAVAQEFKTLEQKIKDFNSEAFMKKMLWSAAEKLIQTEQEKINNVNEWGIETLIKDLEYREIKEVEKWTYEKLLGTKEAPGILRKIHIRLKSEEALQEDDIRELMAATEWTDIHILPRDESKNGTTIQYVFTDKHGNRLWLPKNICVNPTLDHANQYEAARDFVVNEYELNGLNVLGKAGSGFREILSELTEMVKTNNEKSGTLIESLFRNGWSFATFGLETYAVDYLGNKYFIGPWNLVESAFLNLKNPEDRLEMQEGLVEYGQSLAPVFVITATKNMVSGHGFWWFKNRGVVNGILKNSIVQSVTYPLEIIKKWAQGWKIATKYIFNRVFAGDYKSVFSDPKNQLKAYFYENIHRMKSLQKFIPTEKLREIWGKHANVAKLEEARKILYKAKQSYLRWGNVNEAIKILGHSSKHFEWLTPGKLVSNQQIQDLISRVETEIENEKKALGSLEWKVREHVSQHPESLRQSPTSGKVTLDPANPNHKKMMDDFMEKSRPKLRQIEEERAKAGQLLKENKITPAEYDQKMKVWSQREGKIMRLQEAIHMRLHGTPLHWAKKLGRFARGLGGLVLTIGAVVGAQMAIEKWKTDETGIPLPELDNESDEEQENEDSFYGFWKKEGDKKKVDSNENWGEKIPEDIKPCLEKIEAITAQYQLSFFCDAEAIAKADDSTIEKNIQLIEDGHDGLVTRMKSLLKEYREPLKKYWAELKKQWEAINVKSENLGHLNAFMAITEKKDWLYLESMNKTDVSETLWGIVDGVKNGWIGQRIFETGMGVLPITAEIQDIQFAYREFSRGHIGDGFVHVGFFFLDTVLDVASLAAGVATAPAAWAGWVAVWAGAIGIRGALKQGAKWVAKKAIKWLKFEKIQWFVRVIGESEKFQKHMTPWLSGIRGKALRLPSGDLVNAGIDLPRSDSIKLDQL